MRLLSDDLTRETADALIAAGMVVLVMFDGTLRPPVDGRRQAPHVPSAGHRAARWVIAEAYADKLHDNATVAAVRVSPPSD